MVAKAKRRLERNRTHREVQEDLERRRCIGIDLAMSAGDDGIAVHGLASHGGRGTPACASPVVRRHRTGEQMARSVNAEQGAEELDEMSPRAPKTGAEEPGDVPPCSPSNDGLVRGPGAPCLWNGHWPSPRSSYLHTHPSGAVFHMSENFVLSGSECSDSDDGMGIQSLEREAQGLAPNGFSVLNNTSNDATEREAHGDNDAINATFENGYMCQDDIGNITSDDAMSLQSDAPEARTALHCSMHSLFGSDSEEDQDMEDLFEPFASLASSSAMAPATGVDTFVPKRKGRGGAEAQVPGSPAVWTSQQLNSSKQNTRRAKEKAAKTAAMMTRSQPAVGLAAGPVVAGSVGGAAAQTPVIRAKKSTKAKAAASGGAESGQNTTRLLDTVAAFWERKKARAEASAAE